MTHVLFFIQQVVHDSIFFRLVAIEKSKEAWGVLQQTYEGINKLKVIKLQYHRRELESLRLLSCRIHNLCKSFSLELLE